MCLPYLEPYIHKPIVAQAVAAAIVFFATLIVVSLFTVRDFRCDSRQQDRRARSFARLRIRRGARLSARRRRLLDLQLAGRRQAAAGMGEERQDAPGADRNRQQYHRHAAGGRGRHAGELDQVEGRAVADEEPPDEATAPSTPSPPMANRRVAPAPAPRPRCAEDRRGDAIRRRKAEAGRADQQACHACPRRRRPSRHVPTPAKTGRRANVRRPRFSQTSSRVDPRRRSPARGMRRLRHFRPPRRRRDHRARAPRPAAPRTGSGGHRRLRRRAVPFRAAARPRRRSFLQRRDDRAAAGLGRGRPCPLRHDRRDHPAQRAAAVRRTRRGRPRGRAQRQPDQRPDAAARTHQRRRDLPVDLGHRGRAAAVRAIAPAAHRRALRRGAARRSRAPTRWSRSPTRS